MSRHFPHLLVLLDTESDSVYIEMPKNDYLTVEPLNPDPSFSCIDRFIFMVPAQIVFI